jgi:hypothetical protein
MNALRYLAILTTAFYVISCDLNNPDRRADNLPRANGAPGQVFVIMDSSQWAGKLGDECRSIFAAEIPTLPRKEPQFDLNYFSPSDFQGFLKRQKTIIFVTVLGDKSPDNRRLKSYFTEESLQMIEDDPSLFMYAKQNEFAKGQDILHLFGETADDLIANLSANRHKVLNHLLKIEEERSHSALYGGNYEKGLSDYIRQQLGCEIKVPAGFDIGVEGERFVWLRNFSPDIDKSVFISWVDYTSEDLFSQDSLLHLRTEVSKPYIRYKPEDPDSYMLTETDNFEVFREEVNFKGLYAVQLKGLWKLNKYFMGGPFVSYAMVDEATNRLYYIEAFLYSPGREQRNTMRELETVLRTFKIPEQPV